VDAPNGDAKILQRYVEAFERATHAGTLTRRCGPFPTVYCLLLVLRWTGARSTTTNPPR
jgi:hypothetical protein